MVQHLSKAPGKVILVDNTSSQDVADAYPRMLERGINIVTPNKKGFSGSYALWKEIFAKADSPAIVYHESTVGAGLPVISTLKDLVDTGDEIRRIEGVFSGTMSFLFNSFAPLGGGGGKFSDEVKKAKQLGYTVGPRNSTLKQPKRLIYSSLGTGSKRRPKWSRRGAQTHDSCSPVWSAG